VNWKFIVKRFNPNKPTSKHEIIDTYASEEAAHRRTNKEIGFCYVQPIKQRKTKVNKIKLILLMTLIFILTGCTFRSTHHRYDSYHPRDTIIYPNSTHRHVAPRRTVRHRIRRYQRQQRHHRQTHRRVAPHSRRHRRN